MSPCETVKAIPPAREGMERPALLRCLFWNRPLGTAGPFKPPAQQNGSSVESGVHTVCPVDPVRHLGVCADDSEKPDTACVSCQLPCNHSPQNLTAYNNTRLLSHSFYGPGGWGDLARCCAMAPPTGCRPTTWAAVSSRFS